MHDHLCCRMYAVNLPGVASVGLGDVCEGCIEAVLQFFIGLIAEEGAGPRSKCDLCFIMTCATI